MPNDPPEGFPKSKTMEEHANEFHEPPDNLPRAGADARGAVPEKNEGFLTLMKKMGGRVRDFLDGGDPGLYKRTMTEIEKNRDRFHSFFPLS